MHLNIQLLYCLQISRHNLHDINAPDASRVLNYNYSAWMAL